jgi:hypothetical protein
MNTASSARKLAKAFRSRAAIVAANAVSAARRRSVCAVASVASRGIEPQAVVATAAAASVISERRFIALPSAVRSRLKRLRVR